MNLRHRAEDCLTDQSLTPFFDIVSKRQSVESKIFHTGRNPRPVMISGRTVKGTHNPG